MAHLTHFLVYLWAWLLLSSGALAEPMLFSDSLTPCQANNSFSASTFDVTLTPNNNSLAFKLKGVSTISGYIIAEINIYAYGYHLPTQTLDPCKVKGFGLCPMDAVPLDMPEANVAVSKSALKQVPSIAYSVPDLDAMVQVYFNLTNSTNHMAVACVQASLSNGKTVNQKGVAWVTAFIAGLALVASAVTSGLGHSNTAAHVAANAMALFSYFQAQAFVGMLAVPLPPIVASWTQNFQWTMGIIRVGFLQTLATWYQRATGGSPSTLLSTIGYTSVLLQKRAIEAAPAILRRAVQTEDKLETTGSVTIKGIERVGFKAGIEVTNIFLTGYIFFLVFVLLVVVVVLIFKAILDALVKAGKMPNDKFQDFRNGWTTVLKGIIFRIVLIGYPQMVVLCFWEFTRNKKDSAAETTLAFFTIATMFIILGWASSKVIRLARRSIALHGNPAYILYSDPISLNKWGFIYVQFRAAAYYFIIPTLIYILVKGMFVALCQSSGIAQAIALLLLELGFLILVCVLRPFMDKSINAFHISICVINFLNSVFVLVFSGVFHQPRIVSGVMGVVFFVINAIFSTVLLVIVLVASIFAIVSKNPDTRYQPMQDDRGSFIKSQTHLTTELDALGGATREQKSLSPFDDDKRASVTVSVKSPAQASFDSFPSPRMEQTPSPRPTPPPQQQMQTRQMASPTQMQPSRQGTPQQGPPWQGTPQQGPFRQGTPQQGPPRQGTPQQGPFRPNTPQQGPTRQGPPPQFSNRSAPSYSNGGGGGGYGGPGSGQGMRPNRQQTSSPWQRGAGYD